MINNNSGVYCIINTVNRKMYVGSAYNLKKRWIQHVSKLNNGTHQNTHLTSSWKKYGKDKFLFIIVEYCDIETLRQKEENYIKLYDLCDNKNGYNKMGDANVYTLSFASRRKMAMTKTGKFIPIIDNPDLSKCIYGHDYPELLNRGESPPYCKTCFNERQQRKRALAKLNRLPKEPKKICSKGHELTDENTGIHIRKSGRSNRYCRICYNVNKRTYIARLKSNRSS
jgi:group I intron endonuclease